MKPARVQVFDGLRLTTEHLDHLQAAWRSSVEDLREVLGLAVVYRGCEVSVTDNNVAVQPGLAFDHQRARLVLDEPKTITLDLGTTDGTRFVCLKYDQVATEKVGEQFTLLFDSCSVVLSPTLPPPASNMVTIAQVTRSAGAIAVTELNRAAPRDMAVPPAPTVTGPGAPPPVPPAAPPPASPSPVPPAVPSPASPPAAAPTSSTSAPAPATPPVPGPANTAAATPPVPGSANTAPAAAPAPAVAAAAPAPTAGVTPTPGTPPATPPAATPPAASPPSPAAATAPVPGSPNTAAAAAPAPAPGGTAPVVVVPVAAPAAAVGAWRVQQGVIQLDPGSGASQDLAALLIGPLRDGMANQAGKAAANQPSVAAGPMEVRFSLLKHAVPLDFTLATLAAHVALTATITSIPRPELSATTPPPPQPAPGDVPGPPTAAPAPGDVPGPPTAAPAPGDVPGLQAAMPEPPGVPGPQAAMPEPPGAPGLRAAGPEPPSVPGGQALARTFTATGHGEATFSPTGVAQFGLTSALTERGIAFLPLGAPAADSALPASIDNVLGQAQLTVSAEQPAHSSPGFELVVDLIWIGGVTDQELAMLQTTKPMLTWKAEIGWKAQGVA